MNTRSPIDDSPPPTALSASFNTTTTHFSIGISTGFMIYTASPPSLLSSRPLTGGISICEMLNSTNYLALVGGGRSPAFPQTKCIIWDDSSCKPTITLEHKTAVLSVRLSKTHIAVTLQNSVHIYHFTSPVTKLAVFETSDNPLGLCCLGNTVAVFPGRSSGKVQIVEVGSLNVSIIPAHAGGLRALALSRDERMVASASETGTLVRVFSVGSCTKIVELRRGVDAAWIFSVAFSPEGGMLAVTSDKATLHVFDIAAERSRMMTGSRGDGEEGDGGNKWGLFSKIPLLPRIFSDRYSFASCGFEMGDEGKGDLPSLGTLSVRERKGILGWVDEGTILVLGTGRDGRWERFRLGERMVRVGNEDVMKRDIWKDGWKRYLGS